MKNSLYKKGVVFGIVILFIGMSITSSSGINLVKQSTKAILDGNILYVGGSGPGNYSNIQDALDDAVDNDTVFVFDDSSPYYKNLIISNSISLIGEDRDTTIIDGSGIGKVVDIKENYATINGFTIQNSGPEKNDAGIIMNTHYSKVINNNIKNNKNIGILFNANNNLVSQNDISFNVGAGIKFHEETYYNTISNNNIGNNERQGLVFMRSHYNTITQNNIHDNKLFGVDILYSSTGNYFSENDIVSNALDGILLFLATNHTIYNNNILNNGETGVMIQSDGGKNHSILNNNICSNREGILIDSAPTIADHHLIKNNKISENTNEGLSIYGTNNYIIGNEFSRNGIGLTFSGACEDNIISDNEFFNDGMFIPLYSGGYSNVYSNNMVNGKPLVILEGETNLVFDDEVGQLILINCNEITIRNLDISNTSVGIQMAPSNNCRIENNKFNDNSNYGVYMIGSNNEIFKNEFRENSCGLYWQGVSNTVEQNNFIDNNRDARFRINHGNVYSTKWVSNYWNRPRIFMKSISGVKDFKYTNYLGYERIISFPWIGFDWSPAKSPYTIL